MNEDIGAVEMLGVKLLAVWVVFFVAWPAVKLFAVWLVDKFHGPELAKFSRFQGIDQ